MDDRPFSWPIKGDDIIELTSSRSALCEALVTKRRFLSGQVATHHLLDPAWTILLDLYLAKVRHLEISISSLGYGAHLTPSVTTRLMQKMEEQQLCSRVIDRRDRRRTLIVISAHGEALVNMGLEAFMKALSARLAEEQAISAQWRNALGGSPVSPPMLKQKQGRTL